MTWPESPPAVILKSLADLLELEPARWTQGAAARAADGTPLNATTPGAACRCTSSWIHVLAGSEGLVAADQNKKLAGAYDAALEAIALMEDALGLDGIATNIVWWNDRPGRSPADVVAAARRTVEWRYAT